VNELFTSGRAIDVALLCIAVEVVLLLVIRQRTSRGLRPLDLFGQLLAGALLLLGVRCAVTGADYRWTAACLMASFPAHIFDLMRRWRASQHERLETHQA
jgi:hypothetical protein